MRLLLGAAVLALAMASSTAAKPFSPPTALGGTQFEHLVSAPNGDAIAAGGDDGHKLTIKARRGAGSWVKTTSVPDNFTTSALVLDPRAVAHLLTSSSSDAQLVESTLAKGATAWSAPQSVQVSDTNDVGGLEAFVYSGSEAFLVTSVVTGEGLGAESRILIRRRAAGETSFGHLLDFGPEGIHVAAAPSGALALAYNRADGAVAARTRASGGQDLGPEQVLIPAGDNRRGVDSLVMSDNGRAAMVARVGSHSKMFVLAAGKTSFAPARFALSTNVLVAAHNGRLLLANHGDKIFASVAGPSSTAFGPIAAVSPLPTAAAPAMTAAPYGKSGFVLAWIVGARLHVAVQPSGASAFCKPIVDRQKVAALRSNQELATFVASIGGNRLTVVTGLDSKIPPVAYDLDLSKVKCASRRT